MKIRDFIVKNTLGKNSILDKEYTRLINQVLSNNNEEAEERWETYNLIIKELFNIDGGKYFEELRYRLTDAENENEVILDVISRYGSDELTHLLWVMKKRTVEYLEEDFFKRFY